MVDIVDNPTIFNGVMVGTAVMIFINSNDQLLVVRQGSCFVDYKQAMVIGTVEVLGLLALGLMLLAFSRLIDFFLYGGRKK